MSIERIFKPYIVQSGGYKGGKSLDTLSQDQKIYKLSSNENVLGSAIAHDSLSDHRLNIYPNPTPDHLYQALERFYNFELKANQFVAGNGGSDILQMLVMAFLDPTTNCIISNPCFGPYKMFSQWMGAEVRDVPLKAPNFALDIKGILSAINEQSRLLFLTSPNNPTGTYISKEELDRLIPRVPDHVVIVYDEVYYQYADQEDYTIGLPYVQSGANLIAINSYSKAYGMAGLRIGYAYSSEVIVSYLRRVLRPFLINTVSLSSAISALDNTTFIKSTKSVVADQRAYLQDQLDKMGIKHWKSQGNFVLIKTDYDEQTITEKMLDHQIMVRPAGNFGAPGCIRVTIGDQEATEATITALATILNKKL